MIRVAFCIGGYPAEEYKRRADLALSYSNSEIQVGIINVEASPYFYGITPTEIQLVAPAFIDAYRRAEKEGYDAAVPLGMLDLGVDGGRSAVDIPVVAPMEACLHVAALLGDRFGLIIYHQKLLAFNRAIVQFCQRSKAIDRSRRRSNYTYGHQPVPGAYRSQVAARPARRTSRRRLRRADSYGGVTRGARAQTKPNSLAQIRRGKIA